MIEIKNRWTGEVIRTVDAETLCRANLYRANIARAYLTGADLSGADLSGADLSGADLSGANLSVVNLSKVDLTGANLSRADLYRANLSGANLTGANLTGANLSGANLSGVNLTRAIVADGYVFIGNRPMLQIGPIGSRSGMLVAYRTDKGLMLRTGCFFGTADQFVDAVRKTHGDNTHAVDYMAALDFIHNWFSRAE